MLQSPYIRLPVIFVTAFGNATTSKFGSFTVPEGFGHINEPFTKEALGGEIERLVN